MRQLLALAVLLLPACGERVEAPEPVGTGAAAAPAKAAAAAPVRLQPGQYAVRAELVSMEMPGMPAGVADQVRSAVAKSSAQANSFCMTPEQAAKPPGEMLAGQKGLNCRTNTLSFDGGRISGKLDCDAPGGGRTLMAMSGTMTTTGYDMLIDTDAQTPGMPGGRMAMKLKTSGERTGACPA